MWNRLVTRIVARAMPPDIGDPSQEFLAATAAENAVRHTARLAGVLALVLLLAIGWLLYRGAPGEAPRPEESPAARESSRVASELGAENARLQQSLTDLRRKVEELTSQRDALQAKLDRGPAATPAAPAGAETREAAPAQPPAPPSARKAEPARTPEPAGAAAPRERLRPSRASLQPAREEASVRPGGPYRCGDGRTVEDPAECRPLGAPPPAAAGAPGGGVRCGDGRTVEDPADCRSEVAADDLRPQRSAP
ncbi:MAG: hypothetical protein ACE147_07740 [Candidatus Methylomirabilales bacterium]